MPIDYVQLIPLYSAIWTLAEIGPGIHRRRMNTPRIYRQSVLVRYSNDKTTYTKTNKLKITQKTHILCLATATVVK